MEALEAPAVDRILERLDAMDRKLESLAQINALVEQAPGMMAMLTDMADAQSAAAAARGIDLQERAERGLYLLERLTDGATVEALEGLLNLAAQGKGTGAMIADIVDEQARALDMEGVDMGKGIAQGARAAVRFGAMVGDREIGALQKLLSSEALSPQAIEVVSAAAQALVECQAVERETPGTFALLRATREPDVRRALDFVIGVARRFGNALDSGNPSAAAVRAQTDNVNRRNV